MDTEQMDTELIKELDEYLERFDAIGGIKRERYTALFFKEKYDKAIELQELIDNIKSIFHFEDDGSFMKDLKEVVNNYI